MKYVHIERDTNKILGWYNTDINFKMEDKSKSFILDNKDLTDTEIIDNLKKTEEYQSLSNIIDTQIDRENLVINVSYEEKVLLIPENAIKVSEEDWQEAININANCYENGSFILKDFRTEKEVLEQLKQNKKKQINDSCNKAIISGFESDCLGKSHIYQSEQEDQLNLIGLVATNLPNAFKCFDDKKWEYKIHTAEQLKQLLADGGIHKTELLVKADNLKCMIDNAQTIDEVNKIEWDNEAHI